MNDYTFRKATESDAGFLADVVIAAEKSNSDKLSYATLFGISEEQAKSFITSMFEEEIDGCEFSIDSFLIAEYQGKPVASFGAWIEGLDGTPSKLLKSNLISFTFGKDCIEYLKSTSHVLQDLVTEREPMTLQFEYLFVDGSHRGKNLSDTIIQKHEEIARELYPELQKSQVQLYANNCNAIRVYERNGFEIAQTYRSDDSEVLNYLPFGEKCIMEKKYNK